MPVLTLRPNETLQQGNWTRVGGTTIHGVLSDNSDSTYIRVDNRCQLDSEVAKIGLGDVALPAGAKIFSVRVRVRVEKITGFFVFPPRAILRLVQRVVVAALTVNITRLFKIVFGFRCPRGFTVEWETVELAYYTEQPAGGEWTQDSFNDFEVHLGREDAGVTFKISEVYADLDYNEAPVGTATGPTGSITDTTRPLVTWTYSDPESDRQQAWQVRIFSSAQYSAPGFDPLTSTAAAESGWRVGEDLSWTVDRDLVNDSYRSYVQVEQVWGGIGEHRSTPTFVAFTQNVVGPPPPTVTAAVEPAQNRVRLDIAAGAGTPASETFNLEFSDDAGVTWAFVRGGAQLVADGAGAALVYDYEAPLNVVRQYRAQAYRTLGSIKVGGDYSAVESAVPASFDWWLKDPLNPTVNAVLPVAGDERARPRSQGVFAPLVAAGRDARKVVVSGPLYGVDGQLELIFLTDGEWAAFQALRAPGRTLLLQSPSGEQSYVALGDNLAWSYGLRDDEVRYRRATVDYTEVARP